jgi:hypothetical protein
MWHTGAPLHTPYLAPADFYLLRLKSALKGRRFCDATDIIKNAQEGLKRLSKNDSQECFQNLYSRWREVYSFTRGLFWRKCSLNDFTVLYLTQSDSVIIRKLSRLNTSECLDEMNNYAWNGLCFHFIQWLAFKHLPISRPIRRTAIFSLGILEKNYDECILILVIYWKKTGLLHTKISNHNIIHSS